jgi:hypothetical protein
MGLSPSITSTLQWSPLIVAKLGSSIQPSCLPNTNSGTQYDHGILHVSLMSISTSMGACAPSYNTLFELLNKLGVIS